MEVLSSEMTPGFIKMAMRTNQDSSPRRNSKSAHGVGLVGHIALSSGTHCAGQTALLYRAHFQLSTGQVHLPPAFLVWLHFSFLSKEIAPLQVPPNQTLSGLSGGWKECRFV